MFINIVSDSALQLTFKKLSLVEFWYIIEEEYPKLFENAVKILLSLQSTYLSEAGFSSYFSQNNIL